MNRVAAIMLLIPFLAFFSLTATASLGLIQQTGGIYPDPCYHEDSSHYRVYYGSLDAGETHSVIVPACGPEHNFSQVNPGWIGIKATAWQNANLNLRFVSPSGIVYQANEVSNGTWDLCVGPTLGPDLQPVTIESGNWQVLLTNTAGHTIRRIYLVLDIEMWMCGQV